MNRRTHSPVTDLSRRGFLGGLLAAVGATLLSSPAAAAAWDEYTEALLGSGDYEHVAIFRGDGTEVSRTEGFAVKASEATTLLGRIKNGADVVQRNRFVIADEGYSFRRAVGGRLAVAKRDGRYAVVLAGETEEGWVVAVALSKQFVPEKVYQVAERHFDQVVAAASED